MTSTKKPIRWWPIFSIAGLALLGIGLIWFMDADHRQDEIIKTIMVLLLTVILAVLWLLCFSRLAWRVKLVAAAVLILGGVACGSLFQFDGFSGDLVPKFKLRWDKKTAEPTVSNPSERVPESYQMDYPQFLGPNRNAVITNVKLKRNWEEHPPTLVWRKPVGAGWSGFAVAGNFAITQEQEGDWEKVVCYDLHTGDIKWSHRDRARYDTALAGLGPRATPTIDKSKVYTLGSTGILNCLELNTGQPLWSKNVFEAHGAGTPPWGVSSSPLVLNDIVVVSAGGAVAYHTETGEVAWIGHRTRTGYSSPFVTTLAGTEQIILFNQGLVTAHEPATGELLWKQPWPRAECVAQPMPLSGDQLLVSTGYGVGAKLFQVTRNPTADFNVSLIWETIYLKAKFTTIIYHAGYLYGLDDGIFACVKLADGTRQWKRGRYGHGQTLLVSDVLLVLTESGEVVLLEPTPESHRELARFRALTGHTTWNTPALAGSYLLVRNNREAACYQLPTE